MAFTSSCPRCQKQVLVPEGACSDAVVQCPICSGEYALSEILTPPVLIVVHPGSAAAAARSATDSIGPLSDSIPASAVAVSAAAPVSAPSEGGIFSAHRVEPTLHDAEPLLFEGDKVKLATPDYGHAESFGSETAEHAAEAALFEPGPEADHPMEPLADSSGGSLPTPLPDEGHDLAAEAADGSAPWGGPWGGFKDETEHEDQAVELAEPDQDEGLENVNFADITGKAAPGAGLASTSDAAVAVEPPKKKKRKREANPIIRFAGMVLAALLALPCVLAIAHFSGVKLPSWIPFISDKPSTRADLPKPGGQSNTAVNGQTPAADTNATPANSPNAQTAGNTPDQNLAATKPSAQAPAPDNSIAANPPAGKQPDKDQVDTGDGASKAGPTPNKPATPDTGKGGELAVNVPPKEGTKPATPSADKSSEEPSPFDDNTDTKPEIKPNAQGVGKAEMPGKSDADPFAAPPAVAPVNEKDKITGKPEVKPEVKPDVKPEVKPDIPVPGKTETPPKSDADPFAAPPEVAPVNEKDKTGAKPGVPAPAKAETPGKSDTDPFATPPVVAPVSDKDKPAANPEIKPDVKPDIPTPGKTETPGNADADPFATPPVVAPVNEKDKTVTDPKVKSDIPAPGKAETPGKSDADPFATPPAAAPVNDKDKPAAKPEVRPEGKPEVKLESPAPVKPDMPGKPEKPQPDTLPAKPTDLKPDTSPVIGPEPKPEVKPEVKPEIKPAGVGPLQAPSFPAADLDASLKVVTGATTVDAKSYADWCKLAEVLTYVKDGNDLQKQALRTVTEKVASNPQAASAIAATAKKLLDDNATKGGIVLAGTVSGLATKNGLCGTAIRMDGMTAPVMIFSSHPLDVKETQKVIVFGALVADPAKNLPGYPGKKSVVVWADFATAMP